MPTPLFEKGNPGGPGRPPGQRTIENLFRDAIKKIAEDNPEIKDVERDLVITLLRKAKEGDTKSIEIYLDRLYGKPKQRIETDITGSLRMQGLSEEDKKLLDKVLEENT